jgi:signal transduction histidine kinase
MAPPSEDPLRRLVHDLRAPLTVASGFADLLVRRGEGLEESERLEFAGRIADALDEARELLDQAAARSDWGAADGPK